MIIYEFIKQKFWVSLLFWPPKKRSFYDPKCVVSLPGDYNKIAPNGHFYVAGKDVESYIYTKLAGE